jgi:hypothetical protein
VISSIPFAEREQPFPPDYTLSQKRPYSMQDGKRSGSDEKPEYRPVSVNRQDDAHQHKREHETGNSQVSFGLA